MLTKCSIEGCNNRVAGTQYCSRCQDEINSEPYPFANILLGETFTQWVTRITDKLFRKVAL